MMQGPPSTARAQSAAMPMLALSWLRNPFWHGHRVSALVWAFSTSSIDLYFAWQVSWVCSEYHGFSFHSQFFHSPDPLVQHWGWHAWELEWISFFVLMNPLAGWKWKWNDTGCRQLLFMQTRHQNVQRNLHHDVKTIHGHTGDHTKGHHMCHPCLCGTYAVHNTNFPVHQWFQHLSWSCGKGFKFNTKMMLSWLAVQRFIFSCCSRCFWAMWSFWFMVFAAWTNIKCKCNFCAYFISSA